MAIVGIDCVGENPHIETILKIVCHIELPIEGVLEALAVVLVDAEKRKVEQTAKPLLPAIELHIHAALVGSRTRLEVLESECGLTVVTVDEDRLGQNARAAYCSCKEEERAQEAHDGGSWWKVVVLSGDVW